MFGSWIFSINISIKNTICKHRNISSKKHTSDNQQKLPTEIVPLDSAVVCCRHESAKESKRHRWQRIRVDTLVTAVTVLFFVSVAWWIIKPRTADELYQTIRLETQGEAPDLRRIRVELDEFLKRFPGDDRRDYQYPLLKPVSTGLGDACRSSKKKRRGAIQCEK